MVMGKGLTVVRIAIVEDDIRFVDQAKEYLERYSLEEKTAIETECFTNGFDFLEKYTCRFDLILMDIKMPNVNGMTVARDIRKIDGEVGIIFLTNLTQYAIKGYEVDALDYLVKPVEYNLFKARLKRAFRKLKQQEKQYISLVNKSQVRKIAVDDILFVESEGHKVIYHLLDEDISMWESMKNVESKLSAFYFMRCNSYYLVNLRYVDSIQGNVVNIGTRQLKISSAKRQAFIDGFTIYLSDGGKNCGL